LPAAPAFSSAVIEAAARIGTPSDPWFLAESGADTSRGRCGFPPFVLVITSFYCWRSLTKARLHASPAHSRCPLAATPCAWS